MVRLVIVISIISVCGVFMLEMLFSVSDSIIMLNVSMR